MKTVVTVVARPRELAAQLDLPLHIEGRYEARNGLAEEHDDPGAGEELSCTLRGLGIVKIRGGYFALDLVVRKKFVWVWVCVRVRARTCAWWEQRGGAVCRLGTEALEKPWVSVARSARSGARVSLPYFRCTLPGARRSLRNVAGIQEDPEISKGDRRGDKAGRGRGEADGGSESEVEGKMQASFGLRRSRPGLSYLAKVIIPREVMDLFLALVDLKWGQ